MIKVLEPGLSATTDNKSLYIYTMTPNRPVESANAVEKALLITGYKKLYNVTFHTQIKYIANNNVTK